jgi:nucleotide sugar dehydrogenase
LDGARKPDLSAVHAACRTIIENVKKPVLVISESTSYPGTLRNEIAAVIEKVTGLGHMYASSPERVDPGNSKWTQKNTPRLLAGLTPDATEMARKFYSSFCDEVIEVSTPEVAEAAKLFENTFRQVNIALVNEFAQISDALDIPTREVLDAAATKPFGFMSFQPGPGVGGHCIPIYPQMYLWNDPAATVVRAAREANKAMPSYAVKILRQKLGTLQGLKVAVLGAAYRGGVKETAFSGVFDVVNALEEEGAIPVVHDPMYTDAELENIGFQPFRLGEPCDAVIVQANHKEYENLSVEDLNGAQHIIDGRKILNKQVTSEITTTVLGAQTIEGD